MIERDFKSWDEPTLKCHTENVTNRNKKHVKDMLKRIECYQSDNGREFRKESQLCKYCTYILPERIGGSAVTVVHCRVCGKQMEFGNTCVDLFCNGCAKEHKLCKRCGAKMG